MTPGLPRRERNGAVGVEGVGARGANTKARASQGRSPRAATLFARLRARRMRGERGAMLVEFALLLPLLLLIVMGIVTFGITYSNFISLRDGVRQGARNGAVGNF